MLTADFVACVGSARRFRSADALAAAAGLTSVLRQSGTSRTVLRPTGSGKTLKRVFFSSTFNALADPESRTFYDRKRAEGARGRVNVVWAIL